LTKCPSTVVTGSPLPFTITVNGVSNPLYDKYGLPIKSDSLCVRRRYFGAYVNDGTNKYVILWNTRDRES
jgi:hypothetical protein